LLEEVVMPRKINLNEESRKFVVDSENKLHMAIHWYIQTRTSDVSFAQLANEKPDEASSEMDALEKDCAITTKELRLLVGLDEMPQEDGSKLFSLPQFKSREVFRNNELLKFAFELYELEVITLNEFRSYAGFE